MMYLMNTNVSNKNALKDFLKNAKFKKFLKKLMIPNRLVIGYLIFITILLVMLFKIKQNYLTSLKIVIKQLNNKANRYRKYCTMYNNI